MSLTEYRLGDLIEACDDTNADGLYGIDKVKGISIKKQFIETKADMAGVSLKPYIIVKPDCFAYVTVTSRNGEKITIAHNTTNDTYIVSSSYVVFRVKIPAALSSDYLFMYLNRPEFDRYSRFNSWGSARETFDWSTMCDMTISLPYLEIQRKYVAIYNALVENQKAYEKGLDDLKLTCEAYIEKISREIPCEKISKHISLSNKTNENKQYGLSSVRGVSIEKKMIETKADMKDVSLKPYLLIEPNYFTYVPVTSRNGNKISISLNHEGETYICSSSYITFFCIDETVLHPQYLQILFERNEFDRYVRFHSWGSARETFDWSAMCEVEIPIPDIKTQQYIVEMYNAYQIRREINEKLKVQIRDICPLLIRGSLENGG